MNSKIVFGNEKVRESFEKLKNSKSEEKQLYDSLVKAFGKLEKNAFSGIRIQKRLVPKEYEQKFGELGCLWKYNLPNAWRLIYSVGKKEVIVLSIILEWLKHKDYEKRFKY